MSATTTAFRKPSAQVKQRTEQCVQALLEEGYDFASAMKLLKARFVSAALNASGGRKTRAAERLKISREHIRNILDRSEPLLS